MVDKKHSVLAGVDYDPSNDMKLNPKSDGDVSVKYKGKDIGFDNYIDEMEERVTRHSEGKSIKKSKGTFSGFGKGTLKKSYKTD